MSTLFRRVPTVGALLLFAAGAASAQATLPDTFTREGASAPFFVSRTIATASDGGIRWGLFSASSRRLLELNIARRTQQASVTAEANAPASPCRETTVSSLHVSGDTTSLDNMIHSARTVYRAEIVSMEDGFDGAVPSTILAAEIHNVVRSADGFPTRGVVFVAYPRADFRIEGVRFCNAGTHPSYVPQIGDHVLIFAFDRPRDMTGAFLLTRPEQLVFERDNRLFTVKAFANDRLVRVGSTLSNVERAITRSR
jgi:hypothetical protein